jgi:hypothetical protein
MAFFWLFVLDILAYCCFYLTISVLYGFAYGKNNMMAPLIRKPSLEISPNIFPVQLISL